MVVKYRKIIVPLDGSELAEKALPYAQDLAVKFAGEVILVNVRLPAEDPYHPVLEPYLNRIANNMKQDIQNNMTKSKRHVETRPVTVSDDELVRHPANGIVDYAARENADLIVMASHGHSGIKHWALGGVSDRVLHISNIPVLLVRANGKGSGTFNRILVPMDGSELAECILPHVTKIAASYNSSKVVFMRVVEPFFYPAPGESGDGGHVYTEKEVREIELRNKDSAEKYLRRISGEIGLKDSIIQTEVLNGNVAETIIEYANSNAINLIIMSTHGHSGMSRWTLGSITQRVLHYSALPVLLVRARGSYL